MNPRPSSWQVWLTVFLLCGWGIMGLMFANKQNWAFVLICAVMFATNAFKLWRLTKPDK